MPWHERTELCFKSAVPPGEHDRTAQRSTAQSVSTLTLALGLDTQAGWVQESKQLEAKKATAGTSEEPAARLRFTFNFG